MADEAVREVQIWLNSTYGNVEGWVDVDEDGYTGGGTVSGLIRALQHELNTSMDGIFGIGTMNLFNNMYPNGLSVQTQNQNSNINCIINGGFYCRGIEPGAFSGVFNEGTKSAVQTLQEQIGLTTQNGIVNDKILRAILTTDAFTLISEGDTNIRTIQRSLNSKYGNYFEKYIPTNGLYERYTNNAIIMAIQSEVGVEVDGAWGNNTMNNCPTLMRGSSNRNMIYLLQYLLYANGFDPNGFDGGYGNGVESAVLAFQTLMCLDADGICGKQTWSALVVSCGDTNRPANACDTCFRITASRAQMLKNNGFEVVGRYLTGYISDTRPKALAEGELQTILDAGLKAFVIYQENNREISDFSMKAGIRAAIQASHAARVNRLPQDTIIYFAVDLDVYENQINNYIIPYFKGINEYIDSRYKVGIYGPRLVCRKVSEANYAVSSFVADMSSGYACNIGQKIPENWNFDQYKEISMYNNELDIDKVTYRGLAQPITSIDSSMPESGKTNIQNIQYIKQVYEIAKQYCDSKNKGTIKEINSLVLEYFAKKEYIGTAWNTLAKYDTEGVDYISNNIGSDKRNETLIYVPSYNISITLPHLAISTLMILKRFSGISLLDANVADLCGWAGDMLQYASQINSIFGNGNIPSDLDEQIAEQICTKNSNTFSLEDLLQDLDAWNLYESLEYTPIFILLDSYYNSININSVEGFLINRIDYGNIPSEITENSTNYDKIYYLAKQYLDMNLTSLSGIMATIFNEVLDFSVTNSAIKEMVAKRICKKIRCYGIIYKKEIQLIC